jgi:hypothetical protein
MVVMVDESEEMAMYLEKEFDMTANMVAGRVPSIDMISRGVNMFNGDSFHNRARGSAW